MKTKNILIWVLTGLVGVIFLGSASGKLMGSDFALKLASELGMAAATYRLLGIVELLSVILFIFPRTGILGTLLLAAYMGGAIAAHLMHGISIMPPAMIEAFVWIVAVVRFPELRLRLLGK
jgi:hypothetical protein